MKCTTCGKELKGRSVCARCGTYADHGTDDLCADGAQTVGVTAFKVRCSMSDAQFCAQCKVGFAIDVVIIVFCVLFAALFVYHLGETISKDNIMLVALPLTFVAACGFGIVRYIPLLGRWKTLQDGSFRLIKRWGADEVDVFCMGRVYRCLLRDQYTFRRKKGMLCLYEGEERCLLDVVALRAYFEGEGNAL